ncbi:MAG TPA: phosphohydrolase [Cyanothece sp. UBA12306]|nr:phosphohydrolase [Cyanothece sp. UBA12306]
MREQVIPWLNSKVSQHRLQHILGVEATCQKLAHCHGVNPEKAAQAGLMHDLAKFFTPKKLLTMAQREKLNIDPICIAHPHLLHADVSAMVAKEQFGMTDEEVLKAISNHTLGSPKMSKLSCIVFVADTIEPHRGNTPELTMIRQVSWKNIYQSVRQTCDYSLKYLLNGHRIIDPRVILTRNWALQKAKA